MCRRCSLAASAVRVALLVMAAVAACAAVAQGASDTAATGAPVAPTAEPCVRPYADSSPWNTRIDQPVYAADSDLLVARLGPVLTSDPKEYTFPLYKPGAATPSVPVTVTNKFSDVGDDGRALRLQEGITVQVPIPPDAAASAGRDGQIIVWDQQTGDEWGFFQLRRKPGRWLAKNGYHYNARWSGIAPAGFHSRGSGVPYLAGLVRSCEIAQEHIPHALAFAYDHPSAEFVSPATKSDGGAVDPWALPEGARLQLDPAITETEIRGWGCQGPCLTIARALQEYGMYVIDNGGKDKLDIEHDTTARWNGLVTERTVKRIPTSRLRVIASADSRRLAPGSPVPPRPAASAPAAPPSAAPATLADIAPAPGGVGDRPAPRGEAVLPLRAITATCAARSRRRQVACTVGVDPRLAGGMVRVRLSRAGRTYARRRLAVTKPSRRIALRSVRRVRPGRYIVSVIVVHPGATQTMHRSITLS
jgi:hypothetical protein